MTTKNAINAGLGILTGLLLLVGAEPRPAAQNDSSNLKVNVVLVQLNVAVTDHAGNYVSGLRPEDFAISEDKIPEKIATFEEGNKAIREAAALDPNANAAGAPTDAKERRKCGQREHGTGKDRRIERFYSLRYQQLHVSRLCVCAGCDYRVCALAG